MVINVMCYFFLRHGVYYRCHLSGVHWRRRFVAQSGGNWLGPL